MTRRKGVERSTVSQYWPTHLEPEWARHLVIYEIATRGFTSPRGPGSGTFDSLAERLDYLEALGINAIWLSGYSLSADHHFYNVWNQYACVDPSQFDPRLGDSAAFGRLVRAAHRRGIRVILEVVTHGVMPDSPLIMTHPDWFKGGTWGMVDYDWYGRHLDLDRWWVDLWVRYVLEYGVDGFRLDVSAYRPDLWAEIRRRCAESGREIVIIPESDQRWSHVSDFTQGDIVLYDYIKGLDWSQPWLRDLARAVRDHSQWPPELTIEVQTLNGSVHAVTEFDLRVGQWTAYEGAWAPYGSWQAITQFPWDGDSREIQEIRVAQRNSHRKWIWRPTDPSPASQVSAAFGPDRVSLSVPLPIGPDQLLSVQLSCHDNGWEGHAARNPYSAQGSRFLFGYGFLLTPCVPIFMAGEEFNAGFHPIPGLSRQLYGATDEPGTWLYGNALDWAETQQSDNAAMLEDVRRLLRLRHQYRAVVTAGCYGRSGPIISVPVADASLPAAYGYRHPDGWLLVAGNPHTQERTVSFPAALEALGVEGARVRVRNLWTDHPPVVMSRADWDRATWLIGPDRSSRGGLLVLWIEN
jgi:hypothetical protein